MAFSSCKALRTLSKEEAFRFFTSITSYTGQNAASLYEFFKVIERVDLKSLEFHLARGDFEKWVSEALGDSKLTTEIESLRLQNVTGNSLREWLGFLVSRRLKSLSSSITLK